tara:strand:- start:16153 stop:16746 length:594 start_codon:yes stop_codon:yes gene_type:complete
MDAKKATSLITNIVKGCPRIRQPENYLHHGQALTGIVLDTIHEIIQQLPEFAVDKNEMQIAGILHDIGRCFSSADVLHPVVGGEFLEEKGFPRISLIIRTHTFMKESLEQIQYKDYMPIDFLPATWNEILITYASLRCGRNGEYVSVDDKFEIFKSKKDPVFQNALVNGEARIRNLCNDIEKLKNGDKETLSKFNFL